MLSDTLLVPRLVLPYLDQCVRQTRLLCHRYEVQIAAARSASTTVNITVARRTLTYLQWRILDPTWCVDRSSRTLCEHDRYGIVFEGAPLYWVATFCGRPCAWRVPARSSDVELLIDLLTCIKVRISPEQRMV